MAPIGLAILIGAGPATGTGIARILSHPNFGNHAVALLSRNQDNLSSVRSTILKDSPDAVIETFPTDTSPDSLSSTFQAIQNHKSFANLKLKIAIFSVKNAAKKPFLEETHQDFTKTLEVFVGGAMAFAQEAIKMLYKHHGDKPLSETGGEKKGTIIFTGTLGALRTSAQYGSYGASRSGMRSLAQALAREYSEQGIHVVHAIANGSIEDKHGEDQKTGLKMSADAVGKTYLWLANQEPELWVHELDLRPAQEKF